MARTRMAVPSRPDHPSECSIRTTLKASLPSAEGSVVIEEVPVRGGACRIDLALVGALLHGYEIKSHLDVLGRLQTQASVYSQVFDRLTLVVAPRHVSAGVTMVPEWWGITAVTADRAGRVRLRTLRLPQENPQIEIGALVEMLWLEESRALLAECVGPRASRIRVRAELHELIARDVPLDRVRSAIRRALLARADLRVDGVRRRCGD